MSFDGWSPSQVVEQVTSIVGSCPGRASGYNLLKSGSRTFADMPTPHPVKGLSYQGVFYDESVLQELVKLCKSCIFTPVEKRLSRHTVTVELAGSNPVRSARQLCLSRLTRIAEGCRSQETETGKLAALL